MTHEDLSTKLSNFRSKVDIADFSSTVLNAAPLFYPANYALGLIGSISSRAYTVVPGNYALDQIFRLTQNSSPNTFICESDLFSVQLSDVLLIKFRVKK